MALPDIKDFRNKAAAAGLAGLMAIAPMGSAFAEDASAETKPAATITAPQPELKTTAECASLYKNSVGKYINASSSADIYSKTNTGAVGIPIFPGQDLGDYSAEYLGTVLVNTLRTNGVNAECFIHHKENPKGTGIDFIIDGLSWDEEQALSISEALNKDLLRDVINQAKTAKLLLASTNSIESNGPSR